LATLPLFIIKTLSAIKYSMPGAQASCLHERLKNAKGRFDYPVALKKCQVDVRAFCAHAGKMPALPAFASYLLQAGIT
jgi:hypothetical protein